jgi:hypothetical protein
VFWQNRKYFGKTFSVLSKHFLFCQNAFCVYLLGLFIRFGEKLFQGYIKHTEKLSRNRRLEENMESRPFFLVRPRYCPPFPPNPVSSRSHHQSMWHTILHNTSTMITMTMTMNDDDDAGNDDGDDNGGDDGDNSNDDDDDGNDDGGGGDVMGSCTTGYTMAATTTTTTMTMTTTRTTTTMTTMTTMTTTTKTMARRRRWRQQRRDGQRRDGIQRQQ